MPEFTVLIIIPISLTFDLLKDASVTDNQRTMRAVSIEG